MDTFSSAGVEIAYYDVPPVRGTGRPILLIHGFASNVAINWESTGWIGALADAGFRVVAMDVRGHGASAKLYDADDYRPALMAADAARLIDHLALGAVDVMGYSMGARIAVHLALDHPQKVRTLIIGGMGDALVTGLGGEAEIAAALKAPALTDAIGETVRGYRTFAERTKSDRLALAACIVGQREAIAPERLAEIRAPVLVAVGETDGVAGSPQALAARIPGAEAFVIPKRDHMLATGDKAYKAAVLDFLSRHG